MGLYDLTCYRGVKVFPLAPVVSQPVTRVHPLTGEGGARDHKRSLCHNALQSAGQEERAEDELEDRQKI